MSNDRGAPASGKHSTWAKWAAGVVGVLTVILVVRSLAGRQRRQCDDAMARLNAAVTAKTYDEARRDLAAAGDVCKSLQQVERGEIAAALDVAQGAGSAPAAISSVRGARPLPPDPAPEAASLSGEVPDLEAKLAADKAYQSVWAGPRSDLNLFLTYVSELLARSAAPATIARALKAKKLDDAAVKLVLVHARVGRFPDDFATKLKQHLESVKSEPHLGTWSTDKSNDLVHDFAALAAAMHREEAGYQRELISAKASGPLGWPPPSKKASPRPWLVDEVAAYERLALLADLTPDEVARRDLATTSAKKRAEAAAEEAKALAVAATALFTDYQANEVSADDKYKDKKLLVSGVVASIEKGLADEVIVWLDTPNPLMRVMAKLDEGEKAKAAALAKGEAVRMLCVGGTMVLGSPTLATCTLREH